MNRAALTMASLLVGAVVLGVTGSARADALPPSKVFSVLQQNQDVEIIIEDHSGAGDLQVEREQEGKKVHVSTLSMNEQEPSKILSLCSTRFYSSDFCDVYGEQCLHCEGAEWPDCIGTSCSDCIDIYLITTDEVEGFCDTYPDYKTDCDGDGVKECCGSYCPEAYHYRVVDTCVPPGQTTYNLIDDWGIVATSDPIDVKQSDVVCHVDDEVKDDVKDAGTMDVVDNDDNEDDNDGCSVTRTVGRNTQFSVTDLLFVF